MWRRVIHWITWEMFNTPHWKYLIVTLCTHTFLSAVCLIKVWAVKDFHFIFAHLSIPHLCRGPRPPRYNIDAERSNRNSACLINYTSQSLSIIRHHTCFCAFITVLCRLSYHYMIPLHNTCPACTGCQPPSVHSDKTSPGCISCQWGQLFIRLGASGIMFRYWRKRETLNTLEKNYKVYALTFKVKKLN